MVAEALPRGMVQRRARVVTHRRIARDHYLLSLACPPIARAARPGQFLHLQCVPQPRLGRWEKGLSPCACLSGRQGAVPFPLLRRPFSLYDVDLRRGACDLIYKVVGLGTETLREAAVGETLDVLGPLGTTFTADDTVTRALLVGGGVGIPPLYYWAKALVARGIAVEAYLGVQTKDYLICDKAFRALGVPVHVATDDGSAGFKGFVTALVEDAFRRHAPEAGTALSICGPTPMMQAAAALAARWHVPAQVSLEERMGCALGVCMGCIVEIAGPHATAHKRFQRVCTEGPVFDADAVVWRAHG
ncbi:MAG: dihydroorotate dehydrogenase electron transfer subunit [Candidatus Omnitrophica bacterium]|nr:dihydroorotate dehydrogenase electron transfer subunit [Candidatus Omnitrophota bacterium]